MKNTFPVSQNKYIVPLLEKELTDKIIGAASQSEIIDLHETNRNSRGRLLNFNVPVLKDGIYRRVL